MTETKEKKVVTKKPRVPRIPHLEVGKEVVVELVNGAFIFKATQTMTIDANDYVHFGRVRVPAGYALMLNRIYAGEAVAMGVLIKISDNAVVNKFD